MEAIYRTEFTDILGVDWRIDIGNLYFDIRDIDYWSSYSPPQFCTIENTDEGFVRYTTTATDSKIRTNNNLSINGSSYRYIKIRYKIISGTHLQSQIYYTTSGHGDSALYFRRFTLNTDGEWNTVIIDMWDLLVGGDDWKDNTITAIRFDLTDQHPIVMDLDYIDLSTNTDESVQNMQGTGNPLTIDFLNNTIELFNAPVKGSVASLSIYSDENFQWTGISSTGNLDIPVNIYYNTLPDNGRNLLIGSSATLQNEPVGEGYTYSFFFGFTPISDWGLEGGDTITLSCVISGMLAGIKGNISAVVQGVGTTYHAGNLVDNGERSVLTLTLPAGTTDIAIYLGFDTAAPYAYNVQYSHLKMEKNNVVTDWNDGTEGKGGDILYWKGVISPNTYQEAYDGISYPVTITANDGLGLLKNFIINDSDGQSDVTWSGRETESETILTILDLIGIDEFTEYINIYESRMDDGNTDSPFDQAYIDLNAFDDMSVYDALTEILKKYNAVIRQRNGKMIIYRPIDLHNDSIKGRVITSASTTAATDLVPEQFISRSTSITDIRDVEGGVMTIKPPHKRMELTQDYGYRASLLENWEFKPFTYDEDTGVFENWTNENSVTVAPLNTVVHNEDTGVILTSATSAVYKHIVQNIPDLITSVSDSVELSFQYGFFNYGTSAGTGQVKIEIRQSGGSYLGIATTGDYSKLAWKTPQDYILRNHSSQPIGWSGWHSISADVSGLKADADLIVKLFAQYEAVNANIRIAYKDIKIRVGSSEAKKKRKKRKFFQRLRSNSSGGGMNFDLKPRYYNVTYREAAEPATENEIVRENDVAGSTSEYDFILGDVTNISTPISEGDVKIDNIIPAFKGAIGIMVDTVIVNTHTWNRKSSGDYKPILEIVADEIKEQHSRARHNISLPLRDNDVISRYPTMNILGNFQDNLNKYNEENRIFTFFGGEFNVRDREWNVDLVEIVPQEIPAEGTAPAAPSDLIATTESRSQIDLSWTDNSDNATYFRIDYSRDEVEWSYYGFTALTTYEVINLTEATLYYFRVRAHNLAGYSSYCDAQNNWTAPADPTSLTASKQSSSRIDLSWSDNSSGESGYSIERKTTGSFAEITTVSANTTSYQNTGLTSNTEYTYRVRAYKGSGALTKYSGYSNEASDTTDSAGGTTIDVPTGLALSEYEDYKWSASWNSVAGATGYKIRYRVNEGSWTTVDRGANTSYTHLLVMDSYDYVEAQVLAYDDDGETGWSSVEGIYITGELPE